MILKQNEYFCKDVRPTHTYIDFPQIMYWGLVTGISDTNRVMELWEMNLPPKPYKVLLGDKALEFHQAGLKEMRNDDINVLKTKCGGIFMDDYMSVWITFQSSDGKMTQKPFTSLADALMHLGNKNIIHNSKFTKNLHDG